MKYTAKDYIAAGADRRGMSIGDVCKVLGMSQQSLSQMYAHDSVRAKLFLTIMEDVLGYETVFRDPETGVELSVVPNKSQKEPRRAAGAGRIEGHGRRVKAMSDGVMYDTYRSDAVADSFYLDGEHEYRDGFAQELYVDRENRYFLVTYSDHIGDRDKIKAVDKEIALRFKEAYGRYIDRVKAE